MYMYVCVCVSVLSVGIRVRICICICILSKRTDLNWIELNYNRDVVGTDGQIDR